MRQAGVIAAAGLVAFDTMIERLPEDHRRARVIADGLSQIPGITVDLDVVHSNIVVFQQPEGVDKATFLDTLREQGLLVSNYGLKGLRIVTHYEITDGHVDEALSILERTATVLAGEPSRVIA
jgi:threonine aldolase